MDLENDESPGDSMQDDLSALRALFEHEIALHGPFLPLGDFRQTSDDTLVRPTAPPPAAAEVHIDHPRPEAAPPAAAEVHIVHPRPEAPPPAAAEVHIDPHRPKSAAIMPSHAVVEDAYQRIHALIPGDSPLHAMTSLEEVAAYVRDTILVPIDRSRTKAVFGVGNPNADLMVIGEAPGADEDQKGEPFVGRAGQLLDKILMAVKFERPEVYIANILKSRPPNNRDPLPEEVAAHIPVLYKQITLVRPRLLLLVGRTAGNGLLGQRSSLAAFRSRIHDFHGLPVIVTYHPAAQLRNPQWKRPTWEDVQMLRTHYDELAGAAPA